MTEHIVDVRKGQHSSGFDNFPYEEMEEQSLSVLVEGEKKSNQLSIIISYIIITYVSFSGVGSCLELGGAICPLSGHNFLDGHQPLFPILPYMHVCIYNCMHEPTGLYMYALLAKF